MILFAGIPTEAPLALALAAAERARVEHRVLDLREAALFDLQIEWGTGGIDGTIALGDASLPLRSVTGIFARMHALPRPPERRLTVRDAPGHEARAHARVGVRAVRGAARRLADDRRQPPAGGRRAHVEARAGAGGLRGGTAHAGDDRHQRPRRRAREFHAEHGRIVHKSASALRSIVSEWTPADGLPMSAVARLPTLFQALVAGDDVRVHVVGARTFATEVVSTPIGAPRDGARRAATTLRPTDLPDDVAAACVALTRSLGLEFAAVDLKRDRDGVWHGLDVDPTPDYTAFETSAGQPDRRGAGRAPVPARLTESRREKARNGGAARPPNEGSTEIAFAVGVASKSSVDGHVGQVDAERRRCSGRRCARTRRCCASSRRDSASRPGRLAVVLEMFENSDGPKLPNTNGRSKACAAP